MRRRLPFSLIFLAKAAIAFTLRTQYRSFSRSFTFFLTPKQVSQPDLAQFPVDLNQEDENRKQNQQVFEHGRGGTPFCEGANRPILSLSLIIQLYTADCGCTKFPILTRPSPNKLNHPESIDPS